MRSFSRVYFDGSSEIGEGAGKGRSQTGSLSPSEISTSDTLRGPGVHTKPISGTSRNISNFKFKELDPCFSRRSAQTACGWATWSPGGERLSGPLFESRISQVCPGSVRGHKLPGQNADARSSLELGITFRPSF